MYFTYMSPCTHCGVSHCHLRVLDEEMGGLERLRGMSRVKQLESGRAVSNWASKLGLLPQRVQARKGIPQVLQGLPFSWGNLLALLLPSKGLGLGYGGPGAPCQGQCGPCLWSDPNLELKRYENSQQPPVIHGHSPVNIHEVFPSLCDRCWDLNWAASGILCAAQVGAHGEQAC